MGSLLPTSLASTTTTRGVRPVLATAAIDSSIRGAAASAASLIKAVAEIRGNISALLEMISFAAALRRRQREGSIQ